MWLDFNVPTLLSDGSVVAVRVTEMLSGKLGCCKVSISANSPLQSICFFSTALKSLT